MVTDSFHARRLRTVIAVAWIAVMTARQPLAAEMPRSAPALVVSDNESVSLYVHRALSPSPDGGLKATVAKSSDVDFAEIPPNAVIYLCDVARLSVGEIRELTKQVKAGRGLCVFLGKRANSVDYNRGHRMDGSGLLPFQVEQAADLTRVDLKGHDIKLLQHPIYNDGLRKELTPLMETVTVSKYRSVSQLPDTDEFAPRRVVAKLRNGKPLLVDHKLGKGRVLFVLTSPDAEWNRWPLEISWVVMIHTMHDFLSGKAAVGR